MKFNQIFLSAIACSFAFISCDDQVMEWETPEGHNPISSSEIPLSLAEKIANYDYIKAYAQQYTPNMTIGLGLGATNYIEDEAYRAVADANFQVYTTGNAMKHSSVVKNNGSLDFSTIDNFLALVPQDVQIYGHNFLWHTQQKQAYLKSLIAPEQIIETTGNVANILSGDATDFNGGSTGGWGSWGSNKNSAEVVAEAGEDGSACLVLSNNGDGNAWEAQCAYTFDEYLSTEATYIIKFKAKSTAAAGELQFQYQNGTTYGSQGGYNTFTIGTGWSEYEYEFTVAHEDVNRIILNFGKVGATYYIDDIQFGEKIENKDPMANIVTNYSFEDGTNGWTGLWGKYTYEIVQPGHESDNAIHFTISNECANMWDAQLFWAMNTFLEAGKTYAYSFWVKSDCGLTVQVIGQNASYSGIYKDMFTPGTDWTLCEGEFTYNEGDTPDIERMGIQFGGEPGSQLWVDDFKFGEKIEQPAARSLASRAAITYVYKTTEEKKEILLGAMESWIQGIAQHVEEKASGRVIAWDVINEPISDNCKWRGIDGNFMDEDTDPVEENGITMNWADDHWYWGYYIGKDYAVKAFEYARKYCATGTKLFVNDYNLETNPSKLAALIEFVNYIEAGGQTVDGIGTQMHVSTSITREQVDAMFKTMAATGKLVRVTELDVRLDTSAPSASQLEAQANTYQMIFESYKANVPESQQSGITIWTLSDNAAEHEYWLNGDAPNLFDANYARKHAYKGVCDGIAGYDVSTDFSGDDWKNAQ